MQLTSGKVFALKLVNNRLRQERNFDETDPADVNYRLALAREFQMLASLHHPNVIRVQGYGFDTVYGSYFTMELLDHSQSIVDAARQQPLERCLPLIVQLLRALAYIHQRGVIHRDIKPGNVLVVGGEVKLLAFGISTGMEEESEQAGTPDFMAPELMRPEKATVESDLYSVGVLLHAMLTGSLPGRPAIGACCRWPRNSATASCRSCRRMSSAWRCVCRATLPRPSSNWDRQWSR